MAGVNYWHKRAYSEATNDASNLVRRGLVFYVAETVTIQGSASVFFGFSAGSEPVEIEFYDMTTDTTSVVATLLENPTSGSVSSLVQPRNMNRNYSDTSTVTLYSTGSLSAGTRVSSELVGSSAKAGGALSQHKHFVLKKNTLYGISLVNQMNQGTLFHLNLGWSEGEPGATRLWETTSAQD